MKNYKDRTIQSLCKIINQLSDTGCMLDEEEQEYIQILNKYSDEYEKELIAEHDKEITPYTSYSNCVILRDKEDGEVTIKTYPNDKADTMMRDVSQVICFSDCDDTWEVIQIIYQGREVKYVGWMPCMRFRYRFIETGDIAWEESFMNWDH